MTQPNNKQYAPSVALIKDEVRQLESNWGQYCRQKACTLASSTWETVPANATAVAISSQTTSGNIGYCLVTAVLDTDSCYVDNKATMSNGEVLIRRFPVYTEGS